MLEPLSLAAATALAKIVLDKFFEGAGQKLEETATNLGGAMVAKANAKIKQLGELVWQRCFKGKQGVDERLAAAAEGSEPDIKVLQDYVNNELDAGGEFAEQVKELADELHQVIIDIDEVKGKNVQQIFGGQGVLIEKQEQPVIQVQGNPIFNIGTSTKDG